MKIQKNAEVFIYMNDYGDVRLITPNLPNEPMLRCIYESKKFEYSIFNNSEIKAYIKCNPLTTYKLVGAL